MRQSPSAAGKARISRPIHQTTTSSHLSSCTIAGRECAGNGYQSPNTPPTSDGGSPSSTSSELVPAAARPRLANQPGIVVAPGGIKTSEKEVMQFHFFRKVAVSTMSGVFDRKFCSEDIMQATTFHPTVWHATCALAAMYQREAITIPRSEVATSSEMVVESATRKRQELRNFALEQYNAAIGGVLQMMKTTDLSTIDMEILLTTSILFTAIASLQGDVPAAVVHVINGQGIWQKWKAKNREPQVQGLRNKNSQHISGGLLTPNSVEAVMGRLVSQSSAIRPRPWPDEYYRGLETPVVSEEPFDSPEDAYYEFEPLSKAFMELREHNKFIHDVKQRGPPHHVRLAYGAALADWTAKFDRMRAREGIMDTLENKEAIWILQARQACMEIETLQDPTEDEIACDQHLSRFLTIVKLGETMAMELGVKSGRVFSYSSSLMDVYFFASIRCRDFGLRRRALKLLQQHNAREGLCNSRLAFAIARGWVDIEEAPGRAKVFQPAGAQDAAGDCSCETEVFVCNSHRVTSVSGEFFPDDVGRVTYWTKKDIDFGQPGSIINMAW